MQELIVYYIDGEKESYALNENKFYAYIDNDVFSFTDRNNTKIGIPIRNLKCYKIKDIKDESNT